MDRIYLCLAHMSGKEQDFIKEAFDTNWVVPMGPNVNALEKDLENFVNEVKSEGCAKSEESRVKSEDSSVKSQESRVKSQDSSVKSEESRVKSEESRVKSEDSSVKSQESRVKSQDSSVKSEESRVKSEESRVKSQDSRCQNQSSPSDQSSPSNQSSPIALDKKVVCLSAGTAAVHLALLACGVQPGDEVLVQSFTFCASSHPITYLGATPVFIDSERETWNMDPDLLETAIKDRIEKTGKKPKAIIPVALYGMPYQIDRIMEIADRYGIPVIEDAAEGLGSRFNGQVLGTFGKYGVLSFNGNKMITTSGGGALICDDEKDKNEILFYATQARESYPYYQHEHIGYNYRMSNICAGIGRGQMTVLDEHIAHHKHVQELYCELLKDVPGVTMHTNPTDLHNSQLTTDNSTFDSNFWLCTCTLDPDLKVKGQENAYKEVVTGAVGGAAGVTHAAKTATTDCQPNANVEAMRVALDKANIEARPLWKPMHKQPVYRNAPAYVNGVSESLFAVGLCLPAGPYVTDDHVRYIVDAIKAAIV